MNKALLPVLLLSAVIALVTVKSPKERAAPMSTNNYETEELSEEDFRKIPKSSPAPQTPNDQRAAARIHILEQAQHNEEAWQTDELRHLQTALADSPRAVSLLTRALSPIEFHIVPQGRREQILRYTQHAASVDNPQQDLPHLCWAEGTHPATQRAYESIRALALSKGEENQPQPILQILNRWTTTASDGPTGNNGTPVTLTWSFVPDGTTAPNILGGTGSSNLIATLNSTYGSSPVVNDYTQAPWFSYFTEAFAYWSAVTGNTYVYEPNDDGNAILSTNEDGQLGVRGDIRIAGIPVDGTAGYLAYTYLPNNGDMVFDTSDASNFTNNSDTIKRLKNTIAHEHGHGLGFAHVCPTNQTKLMEPLTSINFVGVQFDDALTAMTSYGDKLERSGGNKNNDTIAKAHDLGLLGAGGFQVGDIAISTSTDKDIFAFKLSTPSLATITITPTNEASYQEGSLSGSGCSVSTTESFDPSTRQDLTFRVLDSDGITVLTSQNANTIGAAESISNLLLPQANTTYYLEVSGGGQNGGATSNAQLYSIDLTHTEASTALNGSQFTIIEESCSPANNYAEPLETVTATIKLTNTGSETLNNARATLTGSTNLVLISAAEQNAGSILAGADTVVSFTFYFKGSCGAPETLTFSCQSDTTASTQYEVALVKGPTSSILDENFDSTSVSTLPSGLSSSSGSTAANWSTTDTYSSSAPNSVHSLGVTSANSAYLTTLPFDVPADGNLTFSFKHRYDIQSGKDAGILELSINGGAWTEWKTAGGGFSGKDYDNVTITGEFYPPFSNPIAGQVGAWSGSQSTFTTTNATFPPSALGKSVQVRWRYATNYNTLGSGWYIDDINIGGAPACCSPVIPTLSISATDDQAQEETTSDPAEFTITASEAPNADLPVAYTLSGSATNTVDILALSGVATISKNTFSTTIPVTAIQDMTPEGNESLVVTLANSDLYAIGTPSSASATLIDEAVDSWKLTHFGAEESNIGDHEDFDGDGIPNLAEYALGSDPTSPTSAPVASITTQGENSTLTLTFQQDLSLSGINYIVETSSDLQDSSWTTSGVILEYGPLVSNKRSVTASIDLNNTKRFLRLKVIRN